MCEQTPVDYKDGDIVWVKLGKCWWPGEVHDLNKLPEEWLTEFKKPPLAAVKFFDENSYEYVKSIDQIYSYNCNKKNEFIKKGLELFHRAKNSFMRKFPVDVTTAEKRTNGDPNIIDDPMFSPEKKPNFAALIFGSTSKQKKSPRKSSGLSKRVSTGSKTQSPSGSSKAAANKVITHPRFLGRDDHEIRILVQSPDKSESEKQDEESIYNCTSCGFSTTRIDVIVLHNKSHIQGVYSTPTSTAKKGKRPPTKKPKKLKMTRSKTSSIIEDLDLIEKGLLLSTESTDEYGTEEEDAPEPKRKRKKNKRKPKKVPPKKEQDTKIDIRDNLLAEWEDSEAEEDATLNLSCTTAESDTSVNKVDEPSVTDNTIENTKKDADKSCFDFEEEEDEIIGTSVGRKIPRVIPPADRLKTIDPGKDDADLPTAEDDVNRTEQIKEVNEVSNKDVDVINEDAVPSVTNKDSVLDVLNKDAVPSITDNIDVLDVPEKAVEKEVEKEEQDKSQDPDVDAFKEILETTSVPDLPEIPHALKYEQNFHNTKTIKFPDKSLPEVVSEDKSNLSKPETKEVTETTSKLINPKKRFVKSFEDFEQQLNNEQRKLIEAEQPPEKITQPPEKITQPPEKITQPPEKITQSPEKITQYPEKITSVVEVSKLKTQLMSKLENAEKLLPKESPKNKRPDIPRQSRSLRERILEKQKEEKMDDSWLTKKSAAELTTTNKSHAVESLSPKTKFLESIQPKSPHEAKTYEITEIQRTEENRAMEIDIPQQSGISKIKSLRRRSSYKDESKNDMIVPELKTTVHSELPSVKSRRLSVKMPEIEEAKPFEIEQTAELMEFEQSMAIKVEPAKVLQEEEKMEVSQVEPVVMEEAHTELQSTNKNQINLINNDCEYQQETKNLIHENEIFERKINLDVHEPQKDHSHSESKDFNIQSTSLSNENIQAEYDNENLKSLTETVQSDLQKKEELPDGGELPVSDSKVKLETTSEVSEIPAVEVKKEVDVLAPIQTTNENTEQKLHENVEVNTSIQQYVHTSVSFSCTNSESASSNFRIENKESEDLSALTTLATVSELTTNLDMHGSSHDEKSKIIEGNLASVSDLAPNLDVHSSTNEKGNLTFVTEDDLADGQVEIADIPTITKHKSKPITLSSFSVDFTDTNQTLNAQVAPSSDTHKVSLNTATVTKTLGISKKRKHSQDIDHSDALEKSLSKITDQEKYSVPKSSVQNVKSLELTNIPKSDPLNSVAMEDSNNCDIEDQIPSLVVCSSMQAEAKKIAKTKYLERTDPPEYTSSSKLLEILTDGGGGGGKLKASKTDTVGPQKSPNIFDIPLPSNRKVDTKLQAVVTKEATVTTKSIPKFDPKNSKFVIKSATPGKSSVTPATNKSNKPIILSEKIIKPLTESSESVSVQKVTSKRSNQDIEDIDAFIIQKPAKKMMVCQDDINDSAPVIPPTQPVKKQSAPRGKAKILQQTIIKPASDVIQSTSVVATTNTNTVSQPAVDDNMFDINSMPIVMGDQILTAESIENMPVVLSDSPVQPQPTVAKNISTTTTPVSSKSQSDQIKLLNKSTASLSTQPMLVKTYSSQKIAKSPRIYQHTSGTKVIKNNPAIISRPGKPDKFIIVPPGSSTTTGTKYTVGKRPPVPKRSSPVILPTPGSTAKAQNAASPEPTGNKIMIVTNQQGHQSRVLLTPAQQKLLGYQTTGSKLVKSTLKGNILQKTSGGKSSIVTTVSNLISPKIPGMISHTIVNSKGEIITTSNQNLITSDGQVLMPVKTQQIRNLKGDSSKGSRKIQMQQQKVLLHEGLSSLKSSSIPGQQKTIVIKNQQGQIVKKFQGTDDAFLEQQVAEQVQAIKASGSFSAMKARQEVGPSKFRPPLKRSYPKKTSLAETSQRSKSQMVLNAGLGFSTTPKLQKTETSVPPLAPISPKKSDTLLLSQTIPKTDEVKVDASSALKEASKSEQVQQKPLNQLIIQDALGNQTTITEGQILALPSGETIDGQPQSYMLVTLDEAGNLAPLNNEALLSLDPNLCLGGDLSNMVLQIDEGAASAKRDGVDLTKGSDTSINNTNLQEASLPQNNENVQKEIIPPASTELPVPIQEQLPEDKSISENASVLNHDNRLLANVETAETPPQQNVEAVQTVTCSIGNDLNQQLIITGDPISTQKFIESLTEGNPDLANLLASAEGNILIQTDEQQILINTDSENQVLLPMNAEGLGVIENSEGDGNPMFATQPTKNQDILAAALADTDVFQQEQTASPAQTKIPQSQLSPSSGLYPSGVSNVLGTTLSLSSPIMTPLEVPSSNSKKIPDEETDILTTEVPKNVDLPITITDPNISQTVAQQQVASLIASELTSNLDLPLAIPDQGVPLTSAELNSPSFVYSLPSLDESVDIHQKTFSGPISMPLLTEEPQDSTPSESEVSSMSPKNELAEKIAEEKETPSSTPCDVDIQSASSNSNLQLNSPSVDEPSSIFETSTLPVRDCIKDSEKLQSTSRSFLGTTIETEEGLCTLGGAMCSSLSEPPPDMFDLSVVNRNYGSETEIKDHIDSEIPETPVNSSEIENSTSDQEKPADSNLKENIPNDEQSTGADEYDKFESYDTESRNDGTPSSNIPLNSESSSPAVNIDENSCEIPVQPQIVTDLSSSSFETHETVDSVDFDSNKRSSIDDSIENEKKKIRFD